MCMLSGAITAFLLICCTFGIKRVELVFFMEKLFIIIIIIIKNVHCLALATQCSTELATVQRVEA